ncbi:MAG: peroxiredoxin family protein [Elusimicrobiota bacterium]
MISKDNEKETREFKDAFKIKFLILVDDRDILKNKYASRSFPTLYLLDEKLMIKYRRVGLRQLRVDEKILSEFERTNKISIQIYSNIQEEKVVIDNFSTTISSIKAKEIALNDLAVRKFIEENMYYPESHIEIINLKWLPKQQMYKWIVQIVELPYDCPGKKANTLNLVKVEIDPINGQITNRSTIKEINKKLYKEVLYKEFIDYTFSNKKR